MLLLLAGTCPRGADAGIDVTGAWYLLIVGQAKTLVNFVQRGTSLRVEEEGAVPAPCRAGGGGAAADHDGAYWGATFSTGIKRNDATGFIASSE
jgi:hypothetical protein